MSSCVSRTVIIMSSLLPGLQNRWFDACVGVAQTPVRKTVFGFLAEYAREPPNYFYVLPGSDISTVDDIRSNGVIGKYSISG